MKKVFLTLLLFSFVVSSYGQVIWAFSINGWSNTFAKKVTQDVFGDKIIAGEYDYNSTDFDPSSATHTLGVNGWSGTDVFLAKYDAGNNLVWAIDMGGDYTDEVHGLVTDATGNIYVCGSFVSDIYFTPVDTPYAHFYGNNNAHGFVAKYDKNGVFKHAIIIDGGESHCYGITIDLMNNIYVTGKFQTTADFNPDTSSTANLTVYGGSDIFVAKYDSSGNFGWVVKAGSTSWGLGYTYDEAAHDIQYSSGFLYITGAFCGNNAEFNPNGVPSQQISSGGQLDPFLAKYDVLGNLHWAIGIKGTAYSETAYNLDLDNTGNIYVTGTIYSGADFDPGSDTALFLTNGGNDVFVAKYDANGNYVDAVLGGGVNFDEVGLGIDVNNSGEVFVTGTHHGPSDFDPTPGDYSVGSSNLYGQIFVAGYDTALNFRWAGDMGLKGYTSYNKDFGYGIYAKDDGSFYVCGSFMDDCDFDPTAGTYLVQSNGTTNAFLAYYNGNSFWWVGEKENPVSDTGSLMFPNPAGDFVYVECETGIESLCLFDIEGRKIKEVVQTNSKARLDLSTIENGVFFVEIKDGKGCLHRKKLLVQ